MNQSADSTDYITWHNVIILNLTFTGICLILSDPKVQNRTETFVLFWCHKVMAVKSTKSWGSRLKPVSPAECISPLDSGPQNGCTFDITVHLNSGGYFLNQSLLPRATFSMIHCDVSHA